MNVDTGGERREGAAAGEENGVAAIQRGCYSGSRARTW